MRKPWCIIFHKTMIFILQNINTRTFPIWLDIHEARGLHTPNYRLMMLKIAQYATSQKYCTWNYSDVTVIITMQQ